MGYYCISNVIIEGCENRIFQVCNRQLCHFFSIQSYGRAYPTPRGALPNMWRKYKRKTLLENKGVDRHVRLLPHAAWNAACSNHFLWRVGDALEGSQFWLILISATCLYTVWSHEVAVSCIHFYWFSVAFVPGRQDLTPDTIEHFLWPLLKRTALLFLLQLNNPLIEVLGSYAGVFKGARLSSLTTNACSTDNNIRFPNLDNNIVLSILWKLDLDCWVIQ